MEIGLEFDDDLFEEAKQKNSDSSLACYNAKIVEPGWFEDATIPEPDDVHSLYKCRGDMAFYMRQYNKALTCYDMCLDHLFSTNVAMWKDVQEAKARCYMHLGEQEKATEIIHQLVSQASNIDQRTTTLYLLADLHRTFKRYEAELHAIQCLVTLHTSNPDLWFRLASVYGILHDCKQSANSGSHQLESFLECKSGSGHVSIDPVKAEGDSQLTSDGERLKLSPRIKPDQGLWSKHVICTCLLHARCLLRSVQNSISSFAKVCSVQKLELINRKLAQWDISEEFERSCIQFLYSTKEQQENTVPSDTEKLEELQNLTGASFEDQWFRWIEQKRSESNRVS